MKPEDRIGAPIYPKTYKKMLVFAWILNQHGYKEAKTKPNLFYRKDDEHGICFFADMRGTEIVRIWEDPHPYLYALFPDKMPLWKRRRLFKKEYKKLKVARASFYDEYEPGGLLFGDGFDGYCLVCGEDITQNNDPIWSKSEDDSMLFYEEFEDKINFCSAHCKKVYQEFHKPEKGKCPYCDKFFDKEKLINHHISYAKDKVVRLCRSCHSKIHLGKKYPKSKPIDSKTINTKK